MLFKNKKMKKFIKKIVKKMLRINLNQQEFEEYLYWQKLNFQNPIPIFQKKWVLNKYNKPNSVWFEISSNSLSITKFLSKISKFTKVFYFDEKMVNTLDSRELSNVEMLTSKNELNETFKKLIEQNENVFVFIHSNSTPKNASKLNHHKPKIEDNSNLNILEINSKKFIVNWLKSIDLTLSKNLYILLDDFNELKEDNDFYNLFKILISDKNIRFDVISNIIIFKTR